MKWEHIEGNWRSFVGCAEEYWGRITGDEFAVIEGKKQELIGKIQRRYGVSEAEAREQIREFREKLKEKLGPDGVPTEDCKSLKDSGD
ncbi:CsbD family protein [Guyparkeria hydrothermalis]|uniref:CsbD family protein n=1 Tax=Guyparkeria hydrothermalis TaxID=923 RepID=UPI002021F677|nr:CsbD family protein [Guyparkeria hydrothermalis]MCL7745079.1 CsbD family protein [Guyparkeria hydrothermalis]